MILAGSGRDCEISCRIEVDAWMHVDGLLHDPWGMEVERRMSQR
jgi:hypothetical protein